MTFTHALSTNNYGPAKFIVDANAANGTHTTIASAITSASSGDTIFIRPGVYTENLTLKAGVNLVAYDFGVAISGKVTASYSGAATITNIQILTNADNAFLVSSANATSLSLNNCSISSGTNTLISYTNSNAASAIVLTNCSLNLSATGIAYYTSTSIGTINFVRCSLLNTGGSTTAASNSAGSVGILYSSLGAPISTSSTGIINTVYSIHDTSAQNVACVTTAGTGNNVARTCSFASGSASAISIGAGTLFDIFQCTLSSTNTNSITGAGTLGYSGLSFISTSTAMNPTTLVSHYFRPGITLSANQPAFLAYLATDDTNKTGAGAVFTLGSATALTEVFDQNADFNTNGTFTAPFTGKYQLTSCITVIGTTIATIFVIQIVTSNRIFQVQYSRAASAANMGPSMSILADMDAADTATTTIAVFGEAGDTDDIDGSANPLTSFAGFLVC